MQLGFVSAILPDLALPEVFETAQTLGYDCVELCCWPFGPADRRYAGVTHIDVADLNASTVESILGFSESSGVGISGLGYYPNPLSPDRAEADAAVRHLQAVIVAAEQLGVGLVNTFAGRDWTATVDGNWPRFLSTWRPLVAFAEQRGVRIAIENCPMLFGADEWPGGKNLATCPEIWERMFNDIPSANFGLNFDPSHFIWQRMDILPAVRGFGSRFFHVHAKDARLDPDAWNRVGLLAHPHRYHAPKLPGLGDVDWGQFVSSLHDAGYRGPVCVEVEDRAFERTIGDRRDALAQSHSYLRNFIPRRSRAE